MINLRINKRIQNCEQSKHGSLETPGFLRFATEPTLAINAQCIYVKSRLNISIWQRSQVVRNLSQGNINK